MKKIKQIRKLKCYNLLKKGYEMNCSEQQLKKLLENTVKEEIQPLVDEIQTLKKEQQQAIKEAVNDALKNQMSMMIENQTNKLIKKAEERIADNQKEIGKFLTALGEELTGYIKSSKASEKEIIDKGEKILEILDDMGKGLVTMNESILTNNEKWGVAMLKRFDAVGIGIKGLANRMDSSTDFLKRNNDLTYNAVKRVDENLARKL